MDQYAGEPAFQQPARILGMQPYANLSGGSGVVLFEAGADFIRIQFRSDPPYVYTYDTVGRDNVETMKRLAQEGKGLCAFINTHSSVRRGYVK